MAANTMQATDRAAGSALDVIYARRAVRSYKPDFLSQARIRVLLDAAVHAPTAMHHEPWRFVIVQNRPLLKRISDRAKEMMLQAAAGHENLVRSATHGGVASMIADPDFNIFYDAGTLVIIAAEPTNDFVAADCWLAAENLMLAARANGLGTCVIGFAVSALNDPGIKTELGIPQNIHVFAPIILGVERDAAAPASRKPAVILNWIH